MINPLDDTSRWTLMGNRYEMPQFLTDAMNEMMDDFIASLPKDNPALAFWNSLPKAPRRTHV